MGEGSASGSAEADGAPAPQTAPDGPADRTSGSPGNARRLWSDGWVVFVAAAWVGLMVRGWQLAGMAPSWWQDSYDYDAVGSHPLWSPDLLAGDRVPLPSYLIAVLGGPPGNRFVWFEAIVACLCWAALAVQVSAVMPTAVRRWVAAALIVGFSVTTPVTIWDRSVLSESLGISLLAASVAAGIWFLRRPGRVRLAVLVVAVSAWVATRDSNVVVVVFLALAFGAVWFVERRRRPERPRRLWAVGALALVVVAGLSVASASHGERYLYPLANVYTARVLPYPDRLQWFLDQGMPDLERFHVEAPSDPTKAPIVGLPRPGEDPAMDDWWQWFDEHGRTTWLAWVATHPAYLVTEPLQRPERVYNNADGTIMGYEGTGNNRVPGVTSLLWLPTIPTVAVSAVLLAWELRRRRAVAPLVVAGGFCVVAAGPLAFAAWHSDGMESARHLFLAAVLVRVGALLAVAAAIEGLPGGVGSDEPAAVAPPA